MNPVYGLDGDPLNIFTIIKKEMMTKTLLGLNYEELSSLYTDVTSLQQEMLIDIKTFMKEKIANSQTSTIYCEN